MKRLGAGHSFGTAAAIGIICLLSLILFSTDVLELVQIKSKSFSLLYNKKTKKTFPSIQIIQDDADAPSSDRITFQLLPAKPGAGPLRNATMGMSYRCSTKVKGSSRTRSLPAPPLQNPGIFDFATKITSNLRILFIGDSVGQQFSEAMDESSGMMNSWTRFNKTSDDPKTIRRLNLRGCGGYKETLAISSPLRGGGLHFYWRMTDLWNMANKGKPLPAAGGGGWNEGLIKTIVDAATYDMPWSMSERQTPMPAKRENNHTSFDAVLLNYISWIRAIDPGNITEERYEHSIRLATSVFDPKAIILVTYPFSRRVDNFEQWKAIFDANQMLRRLVRNRRAALSNNTSSQQQPAVLLLEFANFTNQLLWHSGRNLGMNISDPSLVSSELGWEVRDNITELLEKLHPWSHVASVCFANVTKPRCVHNSISPDDQHWCMETIGARLTAGLSCLLGCALNNCTSSAGASDHVKSNNNRQSQLELCEAECNNRFMTMKPIDTLWLNTSIRACRV